MSQTNDIPASLVRQRETAREQMKAYWNGVSDRTCRDEQEDYGKLLRCLRIELGAELFRYLDRDALAEMLSLAHEVAWVTLNIPGHWPIQCRYHRSAGSWTRVAVPEEPMDGNGRSLWRVVKTPPDVEFCEVFGTQSLGSALVVAEMSPGEAEEQEEAESPPF